MERRDDTIKNFANSTSTNHNSNSNFFLDSDVGISWKTQIENTFNTLILEHLPEGENRSYWYKKLNLDKADASRIRRGLMIPPQWLRIKIANFFNVQSELIWRSPDILRADKIEVDTNENNNS